MIFITRDYDDKPLFTGFINGVHQFENNGKTFTSYRIGTSEESRDGEKIYSTWFASLMGDAAKYDGSLEKGDRIEVYGFKISKPSVQRDDGTWDNDRLNMRISRLRTKSPVKSDIDDDSLPF